MAGLTIEGQPDGWLDVGYSLSTLAARLEAELSDLSTLGAQSLASSWYGPAASAFFTDWASRRARYEDLLDLARRAANAITEYGQALLNMQARARAVEYAWCSAGLRVLPGGDGFMLPPTAGALPQPVRMSLEQTLVAATRDVVDLGGGVVAIAGDLIAVLVPVIELLEEFGLAGFGAAYLSEFGHAFMHGVTDPFFLPGIALDAAKHLAEDAAADTRAHASQLGHDLRAGTAEERSEAAPLLRPVGQDASRLTSLADRGASAVTGIGWTIVGLEVKSDLPRLGFVGSLEANAGNIASMAVGDAAVAMSGTVIAAVVVGASPVAVAVGAVVIGGIVAVGVGAVVQTIVNHNKDTINHWAHDVESVI
jgi:hypothetical protein